MKECRGKESPEFQLEFIELTTCNSVGEENEKCKSLEPKKHCIWFAKMVSFKYASLLKITTSEGTIEKTLNPVLLAKYQDFGLSWKINIV